MPGKSEKEQEFDIEGYWKQLEEDIGEKIIARSLGQYVGGYEGWDTEYWGLFFLTDSALYFKHFRQENWLSSMLGSFGRGKRDEDREFRISRGTIVSVNRKKSPPAILRFILPVDPEVYLVCRAQDGTDHTVLVRIEQDTESFVGALKTV